MVVAVLFYFLNRRFDGPGRRYREVLKWTGDRNFARLATLRYWYESYSVTIFALINNETHKYDSLESFINSYDSIVCNRNKVHPPIVLSHWFIWVKLGLETYLFVCADAESRNTFNWRCQKSGIDNAIYDVVLRDRNHNGKAIQVAGSEYAQAKKVLSIVSIYNDITEFTARYTLDKAVRAVPTDKSIKDFDHAAQVMFAIVNEACKDEPIQIDATDD